MSMAGRAAGREDGADPVSDLELTATDDLLAEIERRFDYMVFAAVKELGASLAENQHAERWKGHVTFCAGMATDLIRSMQDWAQQRDDADGDDPE